MKLSTASLEAAETTAEMPRRRGQYGGEDSSRAGLAGKEAIGGGAGSRIIISPRNQRLSDRFFFSEIVRLFC